MNEYKIIYGFNGSARSRVYLAESDGEAIENWENEMERFDADIEFVDIIEIEVDHV